MQELICTRRVLILGFIVLTYVLGFWTHGGKGEQTVAAQKKKEIPEKPTKFYLGVEACVECHSAGARRRPVLCRCTEVATWEKNDKHPLAYKVLTEKRAQAMGKALGIEEVTKEKACVSCHGVYLDAAQLKDKSLVDPTFKMSEGVNCVACHGAYAEWAEAHAGPLEWQRQWWRSIHRRAKETHFGMTDLWEPVKRSQLCLSCHLGNVAAGKFLTHAMYAAGHPLLPAIEMAAFCDDMPRQWQYIAEKEVNAQKLLNFETDQAAIERTRLVLVGGLVGLRESINLVASQAKKAAKFDAREETEGLLDLALFDCYACHQDLKGSSRRPQQGHKSRPGRPQLQAWPSILVRGALHSLGRDAREVDRAMKPLFEVFDSRPFPNPAPVAAEARRVVEWIDKLTDQFKDRKWDVATTDRVLDALLTVKEDDYLDYDSARQIAWAVRVIYDELYGQGTPYELKEADKQLKSNTHTAIVAKLSALDKQLKLQLRTTPSQQREHDLPRALERRAEYDSDLFKRELRELAKILLKQQQRR